MNDECGMMSDELRAVFNSSFRIHRFLKAMPDLYQHIRFRVEERVARVTFARPPLNIFTIAMMREVDAALTECMGMRDVVAVVFDSVEGSRAFSAGVSVEEHQPETVYQMLESFHNVFRTLDQMSKPALALVDGAALGGGCELVAGCDIVVAASRSRPASARSRRTPSTSLLWLMSRDRIFSATG